MNDQFEKSNYKRKIKDTVSIYLEKISSPNILEFGVRKGISTSIFLDLCKNNKGKLFSVDIVDYSKLFEDENWIFINSRDDNIEYIEKFIPNHLDILHIDSLHEANHVAKIINLYYPKIKPGGFILVDDISCLPYLKNKKKNSFGNELANQETFEIIQEIYSSNIENFDLNFSFVDSGLAIIKKLNTNPLAKKKKISFRKYSLTNLFRKFYKFLKS
jgi:predicted O-methyltransferase YrrM